MSIYEIPIIASSSVDAGAKNKSSDGSTFEIRLSNPIKLSRHVKTCTVQVDEATIWWTIPNISAALGNNKFYIEYQTNDYEVTIPDGLYSLSDLDTALDRELNDTVGTGGLITLEADNATQKVNFIIEVADVQVDFTQADTFRDLLGLDAQLIPNGGPSGAGGFNILGDNIANLNTISYFLLHSDLVSEGIRVNNTYSQTIAQILIDVKPGSQIISREFNPPKSDGSNLIGSITDKIKFWLTDQDNNLVNTNGDDYGCRVVIKYIE